MKKLSQDQMDELDKIIIQSDELKKKVRIRVPKTDAQMKRAKSKRRAVVDKQENSGHDEGIFKTSRASRASKSEKKYVNLGSLVKKSSKNEASEFRKKSAHWRDGEKVVIDNNLESSQAYESQQPVYEQELITDGPTFLETIKSYGPFQWAAVGMAAVVFVTSIMTTSVYANYKGEQNKAIAFAQLPSYNDVADTELASVIEEVVEEVEPIAMEEPQEASYGVLSLVMTSVEKDLKIKLVDSEDTLVKGIAWGVTVTDSKENQSTYDDEDTDGIIHITDISAGDYSVTINGTDSLNGYTIPSTASQVSVKAKVEYKVIANIKDEIKSEKEVNAAAEDANGNQAADVETGTKLTDTVEWCESTKTENGEQYIEASVDLSKCEKASVPVGEYIKQAIERLVAGSKTNNFGSYAIMRMVAAEEGNPTPEEHSCSYGNPTYEQIDGNKHRKTERCTVEGCDKSNSVEEDCNNTDSDCVCGRPKAASQQCDHSNVTFTYTSNSNGTHKKVCGSCQGVVSESESCSYKDGKCEKCQYAQPSDSAAVTGVKLDQTALSLVVGKTATLKATIEPSGASSSLTWSSSNASVASVSGGTVTAVAAGTAKITVTADGGKTATCEVTVTSAEVKYKATSKLYDSAGNQLFKKSGDGYVEAKYQDILDGISQFFRKEAGYLYTGWQTINNQTYYYKPDHTYVTGDQVIGGVLYHFASDGSLTKGSGTLGIDVSKYQPSINWASVKASGISYVIIRCGYRGASTGALIQDPYFVSHIKGAKAAGLKVGVYFFSTALTEAEAVEEASMCAALCSGYGINYPVFIDVESSSRPGYNSLPAGQRTANIKAFCNTIKSAGYTPGVYANKTWFTSYINTGELSGYKIWLAQYNAAGPTYSGRYDLWQYTSKGSVNGISGNVDMNQSYLGY